MSLRALKKREVSSNPYKKHPVPMRTKKLIDMKPNINCNNVTKKQRCNSLPDLTINQNNDNHQKYSSFLLNQNKIISKSDTDISKLIKNFSNENDLINAKSEISLKTISIHKTAAANIASSVTTIPNSNNNLSTLNSNNLYHHIHSQNDKYNNLNYTLNGRSTTATDIINNNNHQTSSSSFRRMSEQSRLSIYSNRSTSTANDHNDIDECRNNNNENGNGLVVDTSCVLHIPIIGYEVMEERARFTVYKLRVENPVTNDCWLVLRRYTDFVRLNNKLKQTFPTINLQLPRKKLFGDNFNTVFLDNRVQGLQIFVNSIMSKDELRNSKIVRDFFCLDEPPMYSESMEECRVSIFAHKYILNEF